MRTKLLIWISVFLLFWNGAALAQKSPDEWALIRLDYARQEKLAHLKQFTDRLHETAKKASEDQRMTAFFKMNSAYANAAAIGPVSSELTGDVETMRRDFARYYLRHYFIFYDILFVDLEGTAFYTVRSGAGRPINLLDENRSGALGKAIARKPDREVFVDFYHFHPSSEPAAFFIEPVKEGETLKGWIVLQWAINKLNSIFASTGDLGQTGETFLVNHEGLMLTESYFKGSSTILKQRLDDRNIQPKFKAGTGHRLVTDYRGVTALSSFEVFPFLETQWLVVAKIDKDEVTTRHFLQHKKFFCDQLLATMTENPMTLAAAPPGSGEASEAFRVDMDEFLKAENGEQLETWGVKTCTALVATIPGKFSYLAHISPLDRTYNGTVTNLSAQITKKIKNFDIYPSQMRDVLFVIAAPHFESIPNILVQLIEDGFFLSQIRIAYNPSADSVAVLTDYKRHKMAFTWTPADSGKGLYFSGLEASFNAGEIVSQIMSQE